MEKTLSKDQCFFKLCLHFSNRLKPFWERVLNEGVFFTHARQGLFYSKKTVVFWYGLEESWKDWQILVTRNGEHQRADV